ncbi:acyl-CoA dehydrogenase [uncultured Thiodictyon sp.]|jgi:alkylation response protein AidB-like acyl-CoA dehydrogenase|uniref:acyl-CoA dehydrogenase n=1 Tax=uncultured Thiodictyon sp. TaxID=1846217 RepID=UPI0025F3762C|nr:acyl-CoA dehydrogenase [uncultured Thiodictyon sp.]
MSYLHPYQDVAFVLRKVVDFDGLCAAAGHDEINADLAATILSEAGRLGSEVLAPLNRVGDREGARMGAQGVEESPGFKDAYRQFADAGWLSLTVAEDFGGQDLPNCLGTAVNEIWHSANMAFALCPMLSQGAMEAIGHHADDALKALYLPKLAAGEWTGTMNITEADAGSDLAAIKTKARPAGDHYLITGQKLYITWGDHGMTDNIVHLVLARLPDAPPGVKGISLFIVPKFLLDAKGEPGERNAVNCLSLEHKLGIHASPTCLMDFTDAVGFLVGEPNNGLAYMFTMMNHARQSVGLQGLAISERAYQEALQYAKDRLQGTRRDGSRIPIIEFPDVRRMLMTMKSCIEAMRVLALVAAAEADRARYATDPAVAARHFARLEVYTPIVKGWLTELAQELTSLGIQIDGGMGYVEEAGAAQHYRDARILPIYEGTTGIQALDFVGRKMLANKGETLLALLTEMEQTAAELRSTPYRYGSVVKAFEAAVAAGTRARQSLLDGAAADRHLAGSASVNFLMLFGYLCGGWLMVKSAQQAQLMLNAGEGDPQLLSAKLTTTRFFCEHLLPRTGACLASVLAGSESTMALTAEQL